MNEWTDWLERSSSPVLFPSSYWWISNEWKSLERISSHFNSAGNWTTQLNLWKRISFKLQKLIALCKVVAALCCFHVVNLSYFIVCALCDKMILYNDSKASHKQPWEGLLWIIDVFLGHFILLFHLEIHIVGAGDTNHSSRIKRDDCSRSARTTVSIQHETAYALSIMHTMRLLTPNPHPRPSSPAQTQNRPLIYTFTAVLQHLVRLLRSLCGVTSAISTWSPWSKQRIKASFPRLPFRRIAAAPLSHSSTLQSRTKSCLQQGKLYLEPAVKLLNRRRRTWPTKCNDVNWCHPHQEHRTLIHNPLIHSSFHINSCLVSVKVSFRFVSHPPEYFLLTFSWHGEHSTRVLQHTWFPAPARRCGAEKGNTVTWLQEVRVLHD